MEAYNCPQSDNANDRTQPDEQMSGANRNQGLCLAAARPEDVETLHRKRGYRKHGPEEPHAPAGGRKQVGKHGGVPDPPHQRHPTSTCSWTCSSRCVVGWLLAERESATLAERRIEDAYAKQGIRPGQLTVHADRGAPMVSKPVAHLLADLGVTKTHSRPHVSNDSPCSEEPFKTLKYQPTFPKRFGCHEDALAFCRRFFQWHNDDHLPHGARPVVIPASVHYGTAEEVLRVRHQALLAAYGKHPERFLNGAPRRQSLPPAVWINPPAPAKEVTRV